MSLALDIDLTRFALRVQQVKGEIEIMVSGFAGIYDAALGRD